MPISQGLLIADSGPLIALAKLSLLDLPARIYGRAAMPMVFRECVAQTELADTQAIQDAVSNGVITVVADIPWPPLVDRPRLDAGELAAIAMALEMKATLLIDELKGRNAAEELGIQIVGVCGLLIRAKEQGWVAALSPLLDSLQQSGYYISPILSARCPACETASNRHRIRRA